jgi:hypothetical protein
MKPEVTTHFLAEQILPDLWVRRARLTHDEMASMYEIVRRALVGYHPMELRALGDDREELISQFIYCKVFRFDALPADGATRHAHSTPSNHHAICAYFRRYLIDCLRSSSHKRNVSLDSGGVAFELDFKAAELDDPVAAALRPHGLTENSVRRLAGDFIASLSDPDQLVLAGSIGWLADDKGGLSQVASRYCIASYHHRASKLGLTLKRAATPADFASTTIGRWIERTLGIAIEAENRVAILMVLGLLSAQSHECGITAG